MPVVREGLTWGLTETGEPFEETIEQFSARVVKQRVDVMGARLQSLTGEARLRELLLICKEKFAERCMPAMDRESIDVTDLVYLCEIIEHHLQVPA